MGGQDGGVREVWQHRRPRPGWNGGVAPPRLQACEDTPKHTCTHVFTHTLMHTHGVAPPSTPPWAQTGPCLAPPGCCFPVRGHLPVLDGGGQVAPLQGLYSFPARMCLLLFSASRCNKIPLLQPWQQRGPCPETRPRPRARSQWFMGNGGDPLTSSMVGGMWIGTTPRLRGCCPPTGCLSSGPWRGVQGWGAGRPGITGDGTRRPQRCWGVGWALTGSERSTLGSNQAGRRGEAGRPALLKHPRGSSEL